MNIWEDIQEKITFFNLLNRLIIDVACVKLRGEGVKMDIFYGEGCKLNIGVPDFLWVGEAGL